MQRVFLHYLPIIAILTSIPLIDFVRFVYDNSYPISFAWISLLYVFGYIYVLIYKVDQYSLKEIILTVILIKLYILLINLVGGTFQEASHGTSDWARFHVPKSLEFLNEGWLRIYESMTLESETYNGRLTHLITILISLFISFLGMDGLNIENIAIASYVFSLLMLVVIIRLFYKSAYLYSKSINFARRAAFFTALSPFFLASTSNPQKEILLFFSIALFLVYLVSKTNNLRYLIFSLLIMVMFAGQSKSHIFSYFIFIISLILIEYFIGFERALSMHATHVQSSISLKGSYLPDHGLISNIIRGGFGPFFLRPFMGEFTSYTAIGVAKYILYLFFSYFFIKSFFCTKGPLKTMLFIYLFIIVLLPFHGTLKILLLTSFGGIFLDCISQVRYYNQNRYRVFSGCKTNMCKIFSKDNL